MPYSKVTRWVMAVLSMLSFTGQQSRADVLYEQDFSTDVIASGEWIPSDSSVHVDTVNGWLHIASNGKSDESGADKFICLPLPIVVETRMRLLSGGQHYTVPGIGMFYGPTNDEADYIDYLPNLLPSEHFGWRLMDVFTDVHTKGPQAEGEWVTIKAIIRADGGELLAKHDGDPSFTPVVTGSWSIPNEIVRLRFVQEWDAVCDMDYIRVTNVLYEQDFSTDVIASGEWVPSDSSVYVDTLNGWLHIASNGNSDESGADKFICLPLPIVVETRMRLLSGGQNYTVPGLGIFYGPTNDEADYIDYLPNLLPSEHFGWRFMDVFTDVHTKGPQVEGEWVTVKAIVRPDGGELLAKLDGDPSFTPVVTGSWSIPNEIVRLRFTQEWDAVCDMDYIRVTAEYDSTWFSDGDDDGVGDMCDNCRFVRNPNQTVTVTMTGDANESGSITSADVIYLVNQIFKSGPAPQPCAAAGDANCSGSLTSADIIWLVNYVFKSGMPPCDVCQNSTLQWACP